MIMTDPSRLSATEIVSLIKAGQLSVENHVKSLLQRIDERDAQVRAWVYLNSESVLTQARALDLIPLEKRGPLHGLAIGVKDVILTKGMPTRYGSPIYEDAGPGNVDAACIMTLRAAGALIFGKTATTEFAASHVGTACMNPHDLRRTPGGSSSGSAAAVADFQVPFALGSQTAGSTVRPGSFNGIYSFKPTWGAISSEGFSGYSITCDTLGLFARSVQDLKLLSRVYNLKDVESSSGEFHIRGARIGFCQTAVWPKAGPGTRAAYEKAQKLLQREGAIVEDLVLPEDFKEVAEWHTTTLAAQGRSAFLGHYSAAKNKLYPKLADLVENKNDEPSRKAQLEAYDGCARLRPVWDKIASEYDAVVTPSVIDEAPLGLGETGNSCFCAMWTILHAPALNVPGFSGENGLPIGLTIVGPRYTDLHVLEVGEAVGKVFDGKSA